MVRGATSTAGMSRYLVDRILAHPRIQVRDGARSPRLYGGDVLEEISVTDDAARRRRAPACSGLFCFIGAEPATDWLIGIANEEDCSS